MKEVHNVKCLYKLTEPEKNEIRKKYFPNSGSANNAFYKSDVKAAKNYTFDEFTKTLTVLSDDYFKSDFKKFNGSFLFPSNTVGGIIICKGVKIIPDGAFVYFKILKSVTIPDTVNNIGKDAFKGCKSLFSVEFFGDVDNIENNPFKYCSADLCIKVHTEKMKKWCEDNCFKYEYIKSSGSTAETDDNAKIKFCPFCGKKLFDAPFCAFCGKKLPD